MEHPEHHGYVQIGQEAEVHVPCSHWLFKLKASQGHEDWLKIDDSGIAKEWYVNPGTDLGRWTGWNVCDNPPTVLYHRTDKRNFANIMRNGLLPGGGDQHETGRPHVYFADVPSTSDRYISGVRADRPLEIQIDLRMAIRAGLCFFKTESDGVLTRDKVPNYTIIRYWMLQMAMFGTLAPSNRIRVHQQKRSKKNPRG